MNFAYIGNFEPEHSTENEIQRALINNGHSVGLCQEGEPEELDRLILWLRRAVLAPIDVVLWTRTASKAALSGDERYWRLLAEARAAGIPVVGYHLDRWWGLRRQAEIEMDPFFRVDLLVTADGGHQDQWESVGVKHVWLPPAISERNCYLGTPRPHFKSDIAFVGSWQGGYHDEWGHRAELVRWLRKNYAEQVQFWPARDNPAVRGADLNDLYASVKVVVGDSCLVPKPDGSPMTHYCSDRIPETMGRGGVLLHPYVEGITEIFQHDYWQLDDWEDLRGMVDARLDDATLREAEREIAIEHVKGHHTYEGRMRQLVDILTERALL